ncbi:RNA-directed RNA polymerase [Pluteus cervinus]|uniref:RNA-directed RNA polymerase n=1 Tax=Pluteus cervinus TaxID=181527 RepID=A0ACD3AZE5_9AGAR|nr:RNA-directed RNA polymerase [Pluteus cervinus]
MPPTTLRESPGKDDDSWIFTVPPQALTVPPGRKGIHGKFIKFAANGITFHMEKFPSNRILHADDPTKFILLSFGDLRFPETGLRTVAEYISRLMETGLILNGIQYRFYHHSNSQLRGRSCFVRQANTDAELDNRIYQYGDFGKIMNAAKRAKRIGLLFSEAQIDYELDPKLVGDIADITTGDEVFSDGCGLISKRLAIQLAKAKGIIFRGFRYTPVVVQIRYRGYKGVLMLHPDLDVEKQHLAEFRKSMKKFTATSNNTFSVVDYSKPYSFGRLNKDIIVLLSSLGISNEALLSKQQEYFKWITEATKDPMTAIDFLSCLDAHSIAEKVLLDGLEDPDVTKKVRSLQMKEVGSFKNDKEKQRERMIVKKSRLVFGVCDPYRVLKEGQVHLRVLTRKGEATTVHGDVLVVRNPCLHPGDCLKLRAVSHPKLAHLLDCVVFASVARPGHHAAPSMSSGGDLDGDKYFVCWDPDLVPSKVAESYDYPPNKEHVSKKISREDLANHFAKYNNSGVARVAALHAKWVRASPQGALAPECQELNALHSQSVDGAPIKIPDRLRNVPETETSKGRYIIDLLAESAKKFAAGFTQTEEVRTALVSRTLDGSEPLVHRDDAKALIAQLFESNQSALSEYELFMLALQVARKHGLGASEIKMILSHLDTAALTTQQKYAVISALDVDVKEHPFIWNSLIRSDILTERDLYQRSLNTPFSIQRLYSSKVNGLTTFFEYLRIGTQDFTRKLLVLQTDNRFAIGVFMRGDIPWDEDPEVNENVVVCSFLPQSSSTVATLRPCTAGYKMHCGDANLQLYNKQIADTFIFLTRGAKKPEPTKGIRGTSGPRNVMAKANANGGNLLVQETEMVISIALQKISQTVQRQVGRMNRTPVTAIEIHVVSNRDRIAHQLFDLWFQHVPTEEILPRFDRKPTSYRFNTIQDVDWNKDEKETPLWLKNIFVREPQGPQNIRQRKLPRELKHTAETIRECLLDRTPEQFGFILKFGLQYHMEDELFLIFDYLVGQEPLRLEEIGDWIDGLPSLVFLLLKAHPPVELDPEHSPGLTSLPQTTQPLETHILRNLIRCANELNVAVLVALEKIAGTIATLPLDDYFQLLWLTAMAVRPQQLVQEILLVLNDSRVGPTGVVDAPQLKYGYKQALGVVFDRAEEASDECPCDDRGKPRKQRVAPVRIKLKWKKDEESGIVSNWNIVVALIRVDARTSVRLHSHVRLQAASKAENRWIDIPVMDGVVIQASKGEMKIELFQPPPPEMEDMEWNLYNAGSTATSRGMMDAISRLLKKKDECCRFYSIITGDRSAEDEDVTEEAVEQAPSQDRQPGAHSSLNQSQIDAVNSSRAPLSLIWGPPGMGFIVRQWSFKSFLTFIIQKAVDNVLERFLEKNKDLDILEEEEILRVATDQSKVDKSLQHYTIDARVGGDVNENNRLAKEAQRRVKAAKLIFTTCAGAGLGTLRKMDFDIVLIDEASQITEPGALVPLVKGVRKAILVGDHVQLRPTVRNMGRILEYDVSLLERLYTHVEGNGMAKTMLNVQYRSPQTLNEFPSNEFYGGQLKAGIKGVDILKPLEDLPFPWPRSDTGEIIPIVFIPCSAEEDMGGRSKGNEGQVEAIRQILPLLVAAPQEPATGQTQTAESSVKPLSITVLSPYTKQIQALKQILPPSVPCSTVDAFQGRESDIVVFSTVRCNPDFDIGFLEDARRLNVMWTRARLGLIIVGDPTTLSKTQIVMKAWTNGGQGPCAV